MSLHKGNHVKFSKLVGESGELPAVDVRGVIAAAKELRKNPRLRCPYGFCGPKKSKLPQ